MQQQIAKCNTCIRHEFHSRGKLICFSCIRVRYNQLLVPLASEDSSSLMDGQISGDKELLTHNVNTPQPVFHKSVDTKENRHTCQYIADELKVIINDLGPDKVFALVTDNAANMKVAWAHVEETYPQITIGCAAYTLNLLLKDIMALKTMDTLNKRAKQICKGQTSSFRYISVKAKGKEQEYTEAPQHHTMGWRCHHVW